MLVKLSIAFLFLLGHGALWVWLYNRINATGFHRYTIKRIEKAIVIAWGLIPIGLLWIEWSWLTDGSNRSPLPTGGSLFYELFVISFLVLVGPRWLAHRPYFVIAKNRFRERVIQQISNVHHDDPECILSSKWKLAMHLPCNQILTIECNEKSLLIDELPCSMDGYRIGHISDVHLTGNLAESFYRRALDWIAAQRLDMLVVSGDIVDYRKALKMLPAVFGGIDSVPLKFFVLGNHDRVHHEADEIALPLQELGWTDLGKSEVTLSHHGVDIRLLGNEQPWFARCAPSEHGLSDRALGSRIDFRIGVSHSPDQLEWGRINGCKLLLCGHTHGGQIRFPLLGPVIAPSWYGSRFASGVFYRTPTVMHVSRGLSGVHPFRWGCMPEITVLTLVSAL